MSVPETENKKVATLSHNEVCKMLRQSTIQIGCLKLNQVRVEYRKNFTDLEVAFYAGNHEKHAELCKIEDKLAKKERRIITKYFPWKHAFDLLDRHCPVCEYDNREFVEVCKGCGIDIYKLNCTRLKTTNGMVYKK